MPFQVFAHNASVDYFSPDASIRVAGSATFAISAPPRKEWSAADR